MTNLKTGSWTVTARRPILVYEVDPVMAPNLRLERRISLTAKCPEGHAMAFEPTADEPVVRSVEGRGVTIGCEKCGTSYTLDLGTWPAPFPDHPATK